LSVGILVGILVVGNPLPLKAENTQMKHKLEIGRTSTVHEVSRDPEELRKRTISKWKGENNSYHQRTRLITLIATLGTSSRRHPFREAIMETSLPNTWKSPPLNKCNGTIDPNEHINTYVTQGIL